MKDWGQGEGPDIEIIEETVRRIVTSMEDPCKTILWSFYWDGKSLATIAKELPKYKNADSVKTQKSRCLTKVKILMKETYKILLS